MVGGLMFRERKKDGTTALTGLTLSDIFKAVFPVGAYYISETATDPGTLFGGTWTRVKGKFLVGLDEADASIDAVTDTGGAKTVNLTHTHYVDHTHNGVDHLHGIFLSSNYAGSGSRTASNANATQGADRSLTTGTMNGRTTTDNPSVDLSAVENRPPFAVAYMWKRTA